MKEYSMNLILIISYSIWRSSCTIGQFSMMAYNGQTYFISVSVQNTHFIALMSKNSQVQALFYPSPTYTMSYTPVFSPVADNIAIRTSPYNSNISASNTYIIFNTTNIFIATNNFATLLPFITLVSATYIEDTCFGANSNEIYVLLYEYSVPGCNNGNCYSITIYNGINIMNKLYLTTITISKSVPFIKYDNNRIFILSMNRIEGYFVSNNYSFIQIVGFNIVNATYSEIEMKIYGEELLYIVNKIVYWYNITSQTQIRNFTSPGAIYLYCLVRIENYLIIKSDSKFIQYDENIQKVIYEYPDNENGLYKCEKFDNNKFVFFTDVDAFKTNAASTSSKNNIYNITYSYPFNGAACSTPYILNGTACEQNINVNATNITNTSNSINITNNINITINNITNITINNNTINSTNNNETINIFGGINNTNSTNSINSTNSTNINNNNSFKNSTNIVNEIVNEIVKNNNNYYVDILCRIIGNALIISSMRISPKFMFAFLLFLDDLWLYKFHRKYEPEYPKTTQYFMEKIDVIKNIQNQINFEPNFNYFSYDQSFLINKNNESVTYLDFVSHDPNRIFYLYSIDDIYNFVIPFNLLYFLFYKFLHLFAYVLRKKSKCVNYVYKIIKMQTKWWTILVAIVEFNIVILIYSSALQFISNNFSDPFEKLNYILSLLIFFVCILYVLIFYPIVFKTEQKKVAENLLIRCKYTFNSFWFEPMLILSRFVFKTFAHGFLTTNYQIQIITLFVLDIPYLFIVIKMRNCFKNKFIFFIMVLYFYAFMVFNLFFVIETFTLNIFSIDRELFGLIVASILAILSFLMALWMIAFSLYEIFIEIKNNKNTTNFYI